MNTYSKDALISNNSGNYPPDFKGTNMDTTTSQDTDLAMDQLDRVVRAKEVLSECIDYVYNVYHDQPHKGSDKYSCFLHAAGMMEEAFDDLFMEAWMKNRVISGSLEHTTKIPDCESIRVRLARETRRAKEDAAIYKAVKAVK